MFLLVSIKILSFLIIATLLIIAALSDLRYRKIPNFISVLIIVNFTAYTILSHHTGQVTLSEIGLGIMISTLVFTITFCMFSANIIGGGDAKLLSATSLFAGTQYIYLFILAVSIIGGLVAIGQMAAQKSNKTKYAGQVPYGIAISAAGLWLTSALYTTI